MVSRKGSCLHTLQMLPSKSRVPWFWPSVLQLKRVAEGIGDKEKKEGFSAEVS